ncbi:DUF5074 domain-containing protein [Flavobacterium silvaticum]|uniref:Uncharacterized protein n=1 Tax=Flavobacterium silvaticum TaxID=1852020 RepID=A0A972JHN8_9FLAO|nr:DUF5074 domain-containing protein [Flavobacterium silvaticum]NMH28140.1 hypothetical protein [Flavobacterium silvaticum]
MNIKKLLLLSFTAAFFASCSNDDDNRAPLGDYDNGVLVLNEGGTGTVTYISDDFNTVQQDIFYEVNGETQDLGQYTQSIFFDGDRAFVISGSNKITVVNRYTFEYIATIDSGFAAPRYGTVANGKAYVTNSNTFDFPATDDYVSVINLQTLAVVGTINTNASAERIIEANGKIYVSNGFFGSGNSITVIDPSTDAITATIETDFAPNSFDIENGQLYALCAGFSGAGELIKINTQNNTLSQTIELPETQSGLANLDVDNGNFYYTASGNIYKYALNATAFTDTAFVATGSTNPYMGYGFAVNNGRIYISEAAEDFTSDGKIFVYDNSNGTLLNQTTVGLGPNGFYFN